MNERPTLRDLPKVDSLLSDAGFAALAAEYGRELTAGELREALDDLRHRLRLEQSVDPLVLTPGGLCEVVRARIRALHAPRQCRVINATGVILHTSLGRAPLAPEVLAQAVREAGGYSLLELDRATGKRSDRDRLVSELICRVTGGEAATVVNNNAGATMIVLNALAEDREVVCSRAHMVEIGGSYRMPDVMRKARCKLVEVGCTNKTHLSDYDEAITPHTALLLKVHTSNYAIIGFTEEPELEQMAALARRRQVPLFYDLGSGSMVDLTRFGVTREPAVPELVKSGVDILCISGDKLFGGPQAGMIVGRKDLVQKVKKNPLFRMLRCDKVTLALLEATLKLYLDRESALSRVPTLRAITRPAEEVRREAEAMRAKLSAAGIDVTSAPAQSQIGGGSTPGEYLPTTVLVIRGLGRSSDDAARRLRMGTPSVFCRIEDDALLFDARSLLAGQQDELVAALLALAADRA